MKSLSFKSVKNTLVDAAVDGAAVYGGTKVYQIVDKLASTYVPASMTMIQPLISMTLAAVAGDMLLPKKYAPWVAAGAAMEAIDTLIGATVDKTLLGSNLITAKNISVQSYATVTAATSSTTATPAATSGYRMGGYTSMAGYNAMGFLV